MRISLKKQKLNRNFNDGISSAFWRALENPDAFFVTSSRGDTLFIIPKLLISLLTAQHHIDKDLFDKISSGNEEAFRQLFHTCNKTLFSFIVSLVKSESDAKEIIQEIFLNLWINRLHLSRIENPGGWLHTIAVNSAYSHLRKEARFAKRQLKAQPSPTESIPDIYGQIENREVEALVSEAIQRLPVRRRQVFQLSRMEGYSRKEIAEQLNISENTVRNQLVDAVSFVQDYLRKKGFVHLFIFISLFT